MYVGDFNAGVTVRRRFSTVKADGSPYTLAGTPVVSVYKDGSATQSTAGVTLTVDFDGVPGLNLLEINLAADGTFYAAGSDFDAVITAGTVNGVSVVGYVPASFSVENRNTKADVTKFGGTAGTFSAGRPEVNTTHAAGTAWGSGAITAGAIADNAITAAKLADGAIDAATFAAGAIDAAAIAADAIGASELAASAVAEIQSGLATSAEIAALNDLSGSEVSGRVDTALATVGLTSAVTARVDAAVSSRLAADDYLITDDLTRRLERQMSGAIHNTVSSATGAGQFRGTAAPAGLDALNAAAGYYDSGWLVFVNDSFGPSTTTLRGIARRISAYSGAPNYEFTFTGDSDDADAPFPEAPAVGASFMIIGHCAKVY